MENFRIIASPKMHKDAAVKGCGECQSSCQSACKTSCTVANQVCENETRINVKKSENSK